MVCCRLQRIEIMDYVLSYVEKFVSEEDIHDRIDYALHVGTLHLLIIEVFSPELHRLTLFVSKQRSYYRRSVTISEIFS